MINVSDINADVFTWLLHGLTDEETSENYVKLLIKQRLMSKFFVVDDGFLDGNTVGDADCGSSLKSCALAAAGPKRVLGIDISEPSINTARGLAERLSLDNVTFAHGYPEDIEKICSNNGFDKAGSIRG